MTKKKVKLAASGANPGVQVLAANDEPLKAKYSGANTTSGYFTSSAASVIIMGNHSLEVIFGITKPITRSIEYAMIYLGNSTDGTKGTFLKYKDGKISAAYKGGTPLEISFPLQVNTLYHAVITPSNLYINGENKGAITAGTVTPNIFYVGVSQFGNSFPGVIYQTRQFSIGLTAAEVTQLWNSGDPLGFIIPDSGRLKTFLNAEYLASNLYSINGNDITRWVETNLSSKNLNTSTVLPYLIYKVGDVDGYQRFSIPWDPSAAGDNLYIFMNPDMHSQVCLIGSDENTISKTRQKTLTFQTTPLTGVVQGAQSIAELEVTQEEAVYTYEFSIASSVTGKLSAGGQNTTLSANLVTFRNGVQVSTQPVNASYSIPATPGFTLSGSTLTAANRTTVVGGDRSVEVTGEFTTSEGIKVTDVISVTQAANTATYENPVVQLSYPVASAAGETILPGNASWTQKVNYTSGSTQSLSSPGTGAYSGSGVNTSTGAVVVPSKGTTISGVTTVTTATLTVTANGKTGSKDALVTQAANEKTYGDITISEFTYGTVAAAGADATPIVGTITQKTLFTSGASSSENITGTKSFALKTPVSGATINASTGVVTWAPNNSDSQRVATAVLTVTANGKTGTKEAVTSQAAGVKTYANPVVTLSYGVIPASGGTVKPTISYSQTWGWNGSTTGGGTITSGGSIVYSGSGVNTSTGAVTAPSKGTTVSGVTDVTTATATVTLNGKSGTASKVVNQAANSSELDSIEVIPNTTQAIPASGGTRTFSVKATLKYTSGSTSESTPTSGTEFSIPITSWASMSGNTLTVNNRGTEVGSSRTVVVTGKYTLGGKSATGTYTVSQQVNAETLSSVYLTGTASGYTKDTVPYTGGTVVWTVTGVYTYTSGTDAEKPVDASEGNWAVTGTGAIQNGATTTWAQNLSEGSRSATVRFTHSGSGEIATGTTTQLSQDLVVAQYINVVSTYSNSKAGYKAS